MEIKHRSIKLTASGVEKVKKEIARLKRENNLKGASELDKAATINTRNKMLHCEPVLTSKAQSVFDCLKLTLEDSDWVPVRPQPLEPSVVNPPKSRLVSSASFPVSECVERIAQAKHVAFLSTWLVDQESLGKLLVQGAKERSGETRILILDPDSPHVAFRGIDLNTSHLTELEDDDQIRAAEEEARAGVHFNIINSLREISRLASHRQKCERLEIRVFNSTPTMTLLIVDGYVCQGFHWRDHQGSGMPHIEYTQEQNPRWYQAAMDHFNAIWNSRTTSRYDISAREIAREP